MSIVRLSLLLTALPYASTESYVVYNPVTHTSAPPPRALGSAVLQHTVSNTAALGRYIWYFGGLNAALNPLNDLWRLDMQTNVWASQSPGGPEPIARRGASLVLAEQRNAYLFGGETGSRQKLNDLFVLRVGSGAGATPVWEDITTNATGVRPAARTEHTATIANLAMLPGSPHGMLLFGGKDGSGVALADLHAFTFSTMTWTTLGPTGVPPQARKGHTSALLLNSLLCIFGGSNEDVPIFYNDVRIYDMNRNTWMTPTVSTTTAAPDGRDGHSMIEISGKVYIYGGVNARGEKLSDLWSFNVFSAVAGQLRWSQPTAMSSVPPARWGHLGLASMGAMHIIGGNGASDTLLTDAWRMSTGCSGSLSLTGSRGIFSDGDGPYRNGLDCRWRINPALPHTNVRVVITQLDLLDAQDRVEIYDGGAITDTLLATYTGSNIPPAITGSGSEILVRLVTDAAGDDGEGFQAAYQAVCNAGFTWDTVSASCTPCPAGSYSELAASMTCAPCPTGFYAPLPGATQCVQCPAFSTTAAVGSYLLQACSCQPGYFGWNNECYVCSEGASCPGGNLVASRPGWCETTNSSTAIPTFAHCCRPELCPGGINAKCDGSIGLVGQQSCSVQQISWDTLHLVSLTSGTWVTFIVIIVLALLICFCTGLSLGVRRAFNRTLNSVVPVQAQQQQPAPPPQQQQMASPAKAQLAWGAAAAMAQKPSFTTVEPVETQQPQMMMVPPQAPIRTPDRLPAPTHSHKPAYMAPAEAPSAARRGSYNHGEEEVMEISLDDAAAIGGTMPPPQLHERIRSKYEDAARDNGDDVASIDPSVDEETPKKKKKDKKKKEEDEPPATPSDVASEDLDAKKKKKKDKKAERVEEEEEDEGSGEKKKKKKKKKDDE